MNSTKVVNRTLRKYFVYIVIALLAVLVYGSRKSFVKVMGGGGAADAGACETLCGEVLGGVPEGATMIYADGSVEDSKDKFGAGSAGATGLKARVCGSGGAAAAPAPATRSRR